MEANKKLSPIFTELSIQGRKFNISLVFILRSYFKVSKYVKLNASHDFIIEISNKTEFQQIAANHSPILN